MSLDSPEQKGRRRFFLAMAAGVGDAVAGAVSAVTPRPDEPERIARAPEVSAPAPAPSRRRVNGRPTSIPSVRD